MSCQGMWVCVCGDESNEQVERVQSICHKSTWRFCQFDIVFLKIVVSIKTKGWERDCEWLRRWDKTNGEWKMENKRVKLWYLCSIYTRFYRRKTREREKEKNNFRSSEQFEWFSSFIELASEWTHYTRTYTTYTILTFSLTSHSVASEFFTYFEFFCSHFSSLPSDDGKHQESRAHYQTYEMAK